MLKKAEYAHICRVWSHFRRRTYKSQSSAIPFRKKNNNQNPTNTAHKSFSILIPQSLPLMISRFKAAWCSSTSFYGVSGQNFGGMFPLVFPLNLNWELLASHQDDKMMFYKEEEVMNYISKVVLASLSLLKLTWLWEKKPSCIAEQVLKIIFKKKKNSRYRLWY